MNLVLEFLSEAAAEVTAIVEYYEERVPGLGARFRREIESVCSAIVQQSLALAGTSGWLSTSEPTRISLLRRFLFAR